MAIAWPRGRSSSRCSANCWARTKAIAGARAARCTSPTSRTAISAPMRSSADPWALRPARRCRPSGLARAMSSSASLVTAPLRRACWYEVMNMAALWKLPVIYACENNGYSEYTKTDEIAAGSISARAEAFGIESHVVDGQDVLAVNALAQKLVAGARKGERPVLHRAEDLSLSRPPCRRHQPRILPDQGRGGRVESQARSDRQFRGTGCRPRALRLRTSFPRSTIACARMPKPRSPMRSTPITRRRKKWTCTSSRRAQHEGQPDA